MEKILDLDKNIASLCAQYPELKQIMADLGFKDITKPLALNTMGRMMTIKKGSEIKEIPLSIILDTLKKNGFTVIHVPNEISDTVKSNDVVENISKENHIVHIVELNSDTLKKETVSDELSDNEIKLKNYIKRLTDGEDIALVRDDFVKNFSDVSAVEIARAEQSLIKDGTALEDVQRLCDVHSALFHGSTKAERIAEAEKEVDRSAKEEQIDQVVSGFNNDIAARTAELINENGHPLNVLSLENNEIVRLTNEIEQQISNGNSINAMLDQIKKLTTIAQHYGKKDELMFPLLKDKYDYPGPSDVMWGVEDEIRDSLRKILTDLESKDHNDIDRLLATLKRIKEMIYKEENILFPLCVGCFTEEEWIAIAKDMPMFGACMITEIPMWDKVKNDKVSMQAQDGKVSISGGSFTFEQLRAMLNTLPMEITLIDENDVNRYFNEGEKLFTRPAMAIGRPVYSCHPKRVEPMVRMLIHDFKTGKRDSMHIMSEKCGKLVMINYYALRDDNANYLGTLEAVQEMDVIADAVKKGKKGPIRM